MPSRGKRVAPRTVAYSKGCICSCGMQGQEPDFVSTIATFALFQESGVPTTLEDFPACRRRIPAGRPATIDRPVLSSVVESGAEVDGKSPPDRTVRFSCVDTPRYPDR